MLYYIMTTFFCFFDDRLICSIFDWLWSDLQLMTDVICGSIVPNRASWKYGTNPVSTSNAYNKTSDSDTFKKPLSPTRRSSLRKITGKPSIAVSLNTNLPETESKSKTAREDKNWNTHSQRPADAKLRSKVCKYSIVVLAHVSSAMVPTVLNQRHTHLHHEIYQSMDFGYHHCIRSSIVCISVSLCTLPSSFSTFNFQIRLSPLVALIDGPVCLPE
jgi:hypothetical protein